MDKLDWSPVSSDHMVQQRESCASGETGKLCRESHSVVVIVVKAAITAAIGHSEFVIAQPLCERFHVSRMNK